MQGGRAFQRELDSENKEQAEIHIASRLGREDARDLKAAPGL